MALKDIQDKLSALVTEGEKIANKADLTAADMERLEVISVEGNALKTQIEALKKAGDLGDWARKSAGMLPMASGAMIHGFRKEGEVVIEDQNRKSVLMSVDGVPLLPERQMNAIKSADYADAFRRYLRSQGTGGLMGDSAIKVLQEGLDVSGGYLAPDDIQNRVIQKEPTPTVLAGRVTRLTTSRDTMVFPQVTYTTDNTYTTPMRVTWTGETVAAGASSHNVTDPTFGQVRIPIYTAMMSLPVTRDMIEDAAFDLMGWISGKFSETINLTYESLIVDGSGANRPSGITVNSTAQTNYVASGAAATLTGDGIVNLAFNLPPQYDNNAAFVMAKTSTARIMFELKDGNGRYLWSDNAEGGGLRVPKVRGDLLGYPVVYTELMPTCQTASNYPIIFGDLSGYYLVQRVGFTIEVARELKIETNQVLVVGRIRVGGQLVEDWKLRLMKVSAS